MVRRRRSIRWSEDGNEVSSHGYRDDIVGLLERLYRLRLLNGGHLVKYKNMRSRGRIHAASEPEPTSRHRVSLITMKDRGPPADPRP